MAVIVHQFYSSALTECNTMTVIVPMEKSTQDRYPVLWLIPPFGCDHTAWMRHTDMERLSEQYGIMVVMPDMKKSFGIDMVYGLKYHTMLTQELPEVLAQVYPADLSQQMIAGAGEGAFTAMYAALTCPNQYTHTFALSCGSLVDTALTPAFFLPFRNAFGVEQPATLAGSCYDICTQIASSGHSGVWHLIWSAEDPYQDSCRKLSSQLKDSEWTQVDRPALGWRDWEDILMDCLQNR